MNSDPAPRPEKPKGEGRGGQTAVAETCRNEPFGAGMQRAPQMPLQSQPLVQRARLLGEINELGSTDDAADWAHRSLRAKNTLRAADAECVEEAFAAKLVTLTDHAAEEPAIERAASEQLTKAHLRDAHGRGRRPAAQRIDKPYLGCPNRVGCATAITSNRSPSRLVWFAAGGLRTPTTCASRKAGRSAVR